MRTTIDIHGPLLKRAKQFAAGRGKRLADIVNDALAEKLGREEQLATDRGTKPYRVTPFNGLSAPGIDFDSNASVLDALDDDVRKPDMLDLDRLR